MKIEMELWHLILLGSMGISFFVGALKYLFDQQEKRHDERAEAQDKAREEGQKALRQALTEHMAEERRTAQAVQGLERDFLKWQADLPVHYVRREDYVRGQSVIEAKLDSVYNKLELVQIQGAQHG
jgi:hypothetical protein